MKYEIQALNPFCEVYNNVGHNLLGDAEEMWTLSPPHEVKIL